MDFLENQNLIDLVENTLICAFVVSFYITFFQNRY